MPFYLVINKDIYHSFKIFFLFLISLNPHLFLLSTWIMLTYNFVIL